MFSSLQKAKEFIEEFKGIPYAEIRTMQYKIDLQELIAICEDLLNYRDISENNAEVIQRQENYIRLLEKENKELRGECNDTI